MSCADCLRYGISEYHLGKKDRITLILLEESDSIQETGVGLVCLGKQGS